MTEFKCNYNRPCQGPCPVVVDPLAPHEQRLIEEYKQLIEKICKLSVFMENHAHITDDNEPDNPDKPITISHRDFLDLVDQRRAMNSYAGVLERRINRIQERITNDESRA